MNVGTTFFANLPGARKVKGEDYAIRGGSKAVLIFGQKTLNLLSVCTLLLSKYKQFRYVLLLPWKFYGSTAITA